MTETETRTPERTSWRFWVSDHEAVLGVTLMLVIIGTLNVFSSSFVVAGENYDDPYFFVRKQGLNLVIGFVCFLFGLAVDYHILMKGRKVAFWVVAAMLAAVFAVGVEVNGAQRWLAIAGFQLQPAELVITILLSQIAATPMQDNDIPAVYTLMVLSVIPSMNTLGATQVVVLSQSPPKITSLRLLLLVPPVGILLMLYGSLS